MNPGEESILVVEDDPDLGMLLREALVDMNRRAMLATTGREALSFLAGEPVSLLLLDWDLSDMSAPEFLAQLRTTGVAIPPVVLMSGRDRRPEELQWPELVEVLRKPFELTQLEDLLQRRLPGP
ncbi:MAG TPA: response regulator [Myxococcaceae bacterium]|nr:response regulator [Myxococcaceae bacterium]